MGGTVCEETAFHYEGLVIVYLLGWGSEPIQQFVTFFSLFVFCFSFREGKR